MGQEKNAEVKAVVEKHRKRVGRPTKLTEELIEDFGTLLSLGNYIETVCDFLGVERRTYNNWYAAGKKKNGLYKKFFLTVKRAQADAEISLLAAVASGKPGWQSKAWMLERKGYDKWGRKQIMEVNDKPKKEDLTLRFNPNDKDLNPNGGDNGADEHTEIE